MPSLAHEGNPKEDEIIITAGDVLSTAQLTINFASGVPFVVVPPENPPGGGSSSCPDTMLFAEGAFSGTPLYYNDSQSGGSITVWSDQNGTGAGAPLSTWLAVSMETSTGCCACTYASVEMVDIPPLNFSDDAIYPCHDMFFTLTIQGISDSPYAGLGFWIEDGSTVHDFTGYVLAADMGAGVTRLMKYVHGDLCGDGTILGIINAVPTGTNPRFYVEVYTDPHASSASDTYWFIAADIVNDSGTIGTGIDLQTHDSLMNVTFTASGRSVGPNERHNRANAGVVAIGGATTSGILIMGADASHYGLLVTCDSYSFPPGDLS